MSRAPRSADELVRTITIAIDGPSGSGKTTTARLVAKKLGLRHVDTGAMYRAVTLAAQQRGVNHEDSGAVARLVGEIRVELLGNRVLLDGVDVTAWKKRLAGLTWSEGDVERGRQVFAKASCATCHSGTQALGPDLLGVTGRFSRDDFFTAILQPSRDISSRYRTTFIATADGKIYQGMIIYEAVDSLILQTGPTETVPLNEEVDTSASVKLPAWTEKAF